MAVATTTSSMAISNTAPTHPWLVNKQQSNPQQKTCRIGKRAVRWLSWMMMTMLQQTIMIITRRRRRRRKATALPKAGPPRRALPPRLPPPLGVIWALTGSILTFMLLSQTIPKVKLLNCNNIKKKKEETSSLSSSSSCWGACIEQKKKKKKKEWSSAVAWGSSPKPQMEIDQASCHLFSWKPPSNQRAG